MLEGESRRATGDNMVRNIEPIVQREDRWREGRGFSVLEVKEAGISVFEARRIGIPVDTRRKTSFVENIEELVDYIREANEAGVRYPKPKEEVKPHRGRAYRGLSAAGKKMRNLGHKK